MTDLSGSVRGRLLRIFGLGFGLAVLIGGVIGFPCISAWALFGVAMRGVLSDPRKQRVFNLAMAAALLVLAVDILR